MGADLYIANIKGDKGYFRDSYNVTDLLWEFNLSWWVDIQKKFCTPDGNLTTKQARALLEELKNREIQFHRNLKDLLEGHNKYWDKEDSHENLSPKERLEWVEYFEKKYRRFKSYLRRAIRANSEIECSL